MKSPSGSREQIPLTIKDDYEGKSQYLSSIESKEVEANVGELV